MEPTIPKKSKLTVKDKTLAEKAIRVRFNGLIMALQRTLSAVEEENKTLVTINAPAWGYRNQPDPLAYPQHIRKAVKQALALKDKCTDAVMEANELVRKENEARSQACAGAKQLRLSAIEKLRARRDDAILKMAFQGADAEMLAFLESLPTPESVATELKAAGLVLTKALPAATGIGEKNPQVLQHE